MQNRINPINTMMYMQVQLNDHMLFRLKRLEQMCEGFADVVYGDDETPTALGLTTGTKGKRFEI